ncbi:MAG TPA: aldo/keto reductase [Terriglobia bacterium]|nr:aldo/keto reductase [Terriglobia bacterium]
MPRQDPSDNLARQLGDGAASMPRWADLGHGCPRVLRLGLATRGNTHLEAGDVAYAVKRGVNYLNWCGYDDGLARALREGRLERDRVVLAAQLQSRDADGAAAELERYNRLLGTDRVDVAAFYYVEEEREWEEIIGPEGALETVAEARRHGLIRLIGLTTHQRRLGARWVESGKLDLLMIRHNAAHRGAEDDVFPVTSRLHIPVVTFTAQRWGALRQKTPDDPAGFKPPEAREWYRFALAHPAVSVVLMAPDNRRELEHDLSLLDDWHPPLEKEFEALAAHGRRVRRHGGSFL